MSDHRNGDDQSRDEAPRNDHHEEDQREDDALAELRDFEVAPDDDLRGRVNREINRRDLVANGLEFSLTVFLNTCWDHLRAVMDAWPTPAGQDNPNRKE